MHTPPVRVQILIPMSIHTSVLLELLRLPLATSVELAQPTTVAGSSNAPQVFYITQDIEVHFLKNPELAKPLYTMLTCQREASINVAVGKQATIGLDGFISHRGVSSLSKSHNGTRAQIQHQQQQQRRRESSAPQASRPPSRTRTT